MNTIARDETGLRELAEVVLRGKWIILGVTLTFAIAAAVAAMITQRQYTATVLLSVVSNRSSSGLGGGASSIISQFGGIASLAGLSSRGDSERSEALAVLQSEVLTRAYIQNHNLMPILFSKKWDAAAGKWAAGDPSEIPTLAQASERFSSIRDVAENSKTGLVTLTMTWTDAKLAARWANDMVAVANDYMRDRAIRQTERNISYLNEQAAKTDIAQVRSAIFTILESEIRSAMLARGADEYALKVIDPAVVPEKYSSPKRRVWVAVGALSGFFLSIFIVLLRWTWARPEEV